MCLIVIELVGFFAGLTNLVSSVPQLIANIRNPKSASGQSACRNALQCAGNGMWLYYGLSIGSMAMATFSTLGCAMAALLFWQVHRSHSAAQGA